MTPARVAAFRQRHPATTRGAPAIAFFVPGDPRPQGSHKAVPGKGRLTGRLLVVESNKRLAAWRRIVATHARAYVRETGRCVHQACALTLTFVIRTPRKVTVPYPIRQRDGDVSKLVRGVEDALVDARLLLDDKLVVELTASKRWGTEPGVFLVLREVGT